MAFYDLCSTDDGRDRPKPRQSGKQMETGEHLCLFRATSGNRKISTVVSGAGGR